MGRNRNSNNRNRKFCRDVSTDSYVFKCSYCGCSLDLMDSDIEPTIWLDGKAVVPRFCPNCGREIEE